MAGDDDRYSQDFSSDPEKKAPGPLPTPSPEVIGKALLAVKEFTRRLAATEAVVYRLQDYNAKLRTALRKIAGLDPGDNYYFQVVRIAKEALTGAVK